MASETIKYAGLKLTIEGAAEFQKSLGEISRELKQSQAELSKTTAEFGKNSKNIESLTAQQKHLENSLSLNRKEQERLNEILEKASAEYGENSKEVQTLQTKLTQAEAEETRLKKALEETTKAINGQSWTELGKNMEAAGKKMQEIGQGITDVGKKLTLAVTTPIVGAATASAKFAIDFESAFAGVRKTVDATEEEFKILESGIRNMAKELPSSAVEIAGVAEAAGQLGIETPNILEFTRTMIDLGQATNLSADEAATSFARFANIVKMPQTEFDKLGSTVVALGNNFATTEAEIVAMGMRLAGAGAQIGLSEADIMSFSTALSSVGIEAEAGGSAFSKLMINMGLAVETGNADLEKFANVVGMTTEEFQRAFKDDASGAITAFFQGLNKMGLEGESVIAVLDEMGITETRLRDTILRAAGASEMFSGALEMGRSAWEENNALTNEAEQRYATMESRLSMLKNQFIEVGIQIGEMLMPYIEQAMQFVGSLVESFSSLDETTKATILTFAGIAAAIGPVLTVIGTLITTVGTLMTTFGAISTSIGAAGGLSAALAGIAPVALPIVGVFAGVVAAGVLLYQNWDLVKEKAKALWEFLKPTFEAIKTFFTGWASEVAPIFSTLFENVKKLAETVFNAIKDFWNKWGETIKTYFKTLFENVKTIVSTAFEVIKTVINTALNIISQAISVFTSVLKGDWQTAWDGIKNIVSLAWNGIREAANTIIEGLKQLFKNSISALKSIGGDIMDGMIAGLKSKAEAVSNTVINMISGFTDKIKSFFGISSPSRLMKQYFSWVGEGMVIGLNSQAGELIKTANSISENVADSLQIDPTGLITSSKDVLDNMQNTLPDMQSNINRVLNVQNAASSAQAQPIQPIININHPVVREESDIQKIAKEVLRQLSKETSYNSRIGGIALT